MTGPSRRLCPGDRIGETNEDTTQRCNLRGAIQSGETDAALRRSTLPASIINNLHGYQASHLRYIKTLIKSAISRLRLWQLFLLPCIYPNRKNKPGHPWCQAPVNSEKKDFLAWRWNMRNLKRCFWFFLLALLLGVTGSAQ